MLYNDAALIYEPEDGSEKITTVAGGADAVEISFEDQLTDEGAPSPAPSGGDRKRSSGNLFSFTAGIRSLFGAADLTGGSNRRHSTNNIPPHVAEKLAMYMRHTSEDCDSNYPSAAAQQRRPPAALRQVTPRSRDLLPVDMSESAFSIKRGSTAATLQMTRAESATLEQCRPDSAALLPPKPYIPRPRTELKTRRASCAVLPITLGSLPEHNLAQNVTGLNLRLRRRPSAQVLPPIDSPGREPRSACARRRTPIARDLYVRDLQTKGEVGTQWSGQAREQHGQQTDWTNVLCERGVQTTF